MANTPEGKKLTELYRLSQVRMQAQMAARSKLVLPLLSMEDLDKSAKSWLDAMTTVVEDGYRQQVSMTSRYLEAYTYAETGKEASLVVPSFDEDAIREDMSIRGPISAKEYVAKGDSSATAFKKTSAKIMAGAGRDVLQYGRTMASFTAAKTIDQLGRGYKGRGGWRRVADSKPCAFCAMLAGRGPVYSEQTVTFHAHDHCGCGVEPVYGDWEPTKLEEKWRQAYLDAGNEADIVDKRRVAPKIKEGSHEDTILWRMRRNDSKLFSDGWRQGEQIVTTPTTKAKDVLSIAKKAEQETTRMMQSLASKQGATLQGLDYRLKTSESLARKIRSDAYEERTSYTIASRKISDALRYTMISKPKRYAGTIQSTLSELEERGWSARVKNFWKNSDNPYQGVNVSLVSPQGQKVELQFHTKESFAIKDGPMHKLYEEFRQTGTTVKRKTELLQEMADLSKTIPIPPNIDTIY